MSSLNMCANILEKAVIKMLVPVTSKSHEYPAKPRSRRNNECLGRRERVQAAEKHIELQN